jgi:hypothetical protein
MIDVPSANGRPKNSIPSAREVWFTDGGVFCLECRAAIGMNPDIIRSAEMEIVSTENVIRIDLVAEVNVSMANS